MTREEFCNLSKGDFILDTTTQVPIICVDDYSMFYNDLPLQYIRQNPVTFIALPNEHELYDIHPLQKQYGKEQAAILLGL